MYFVPCTCRFGPRRFSPSFCCLQGWSSKGVGCCKLDCRFIVMHLASEGVGELGMWMLSSVMLRKMVSGPRL